MVRVKEGEEEAVVNEKMNGEYYGEMLSARKHKALTNDYVLYSLCATKCFIIAGSVSGYSINITSR